jgi:hypothetical protein
VLQNRQAGFTDSGVRTDGDMTSGFVLEDFMYSTSVMLGLKCQYVGMTQSGKCQSVFAMSNFTQLVCGNL